MANSSDSLAAVFDELLARDKKRLDELIGETTSSASESANEQRDAAARAPVVNAPASGAAREAKEPGVVRELRARYGELHYVVRERRREGDEIIVLCELKIPRLAISKTQFGHAKISAVGAQLGIGGSVGGKSFTIAAGERVASTAASEEAAFERALASALAKCAELV